MTSFQVHTIDSAPEASKPLLEKAKKALGFVPNLYGVMAESPAMLEAYVTVGQILDRSSFTATERQVILLTVSRENECAYCMGAHSTIAGMQHVPDDVVQSLRSGEPIADARLRALSEFTRRLVRERGWAAEDDVQAFVDAGFTRAQVFEVILGVGMKTMSNYLNHVTETPLDAAFQANAWEPAGNASAAG